MRDVAPDRVRCGRRPPRRCRHHSRSANLDEGGVVHTTEDAPQEQHTRFEYQYDDRGNWTEQITWSRIDPQSDFQGSGITRRTITYYG